MPQNAPPISQTQIDEIERAIAALTGLRDDTSNSQPLRDDALDQITALQGFIDKYDNT